MVKRLCPSTISPSHAMMGLMMRPSRKMFASSWFSSSKVSGGILPWNSGSTLSADKFIIKPSFLRVGRFGGCGLDVVVKPKAGLAVGAGFLDGLAGVCAADADATSVAKRIQAAGAEGSQIAFVVVLTVKSTAHSHYLRVVVVNSRYGKSPLP